MEIGHHFWALGELVHWLTIFGTWASQLLLALFQGIAAQFEFLQRRDSLGNSWFFDQKWTNIPNIHQTSNGSDITNNHHQTSNIKHQIGSDRIRYDDDDDDDDYIDEIWALGVPLARDHGYNIKKPKRCKK